MTSPILVLLAPLFGVTFGYKPSVDSNVGYDYTVQVEPELVERMHKGNTDSLEFTIPPEVAPIRRIRVVVGNKSLEKKLRPGSGTHATYRQDLDSATAGLLAQTGPAGGYGRGARGFNDASRGATARSSSTPPPITVPSIGTSLPPASPQNDLRNPLDASLQSVENGVSRTTDAMRDSVNNVGAAGQGAIDNVRRTMGDMISPPETPVYNPASTPLENTTNRLQEEFRNTTDAMRDSINRATGTARSSSTLTPPDLTRGTLPGDRSVLTRTNTQANGQANAAASTRSASDQAYWDRIRIEKQRREEQQSRELPRQSEEQARLAREDLESRTRLANSEFPEEPRLQSLPDRSRMDPRQFDQTNQTQSNRSRANVVESIGDRRHLANNTNRGVMDSAITRTSANSTNSREQGFTANSAAQSEAADSPVTISAARNTNSHSIAAQDESPKNNDWSGKKSETEPTPEPEKEAGLPAGVLAWAIALGLGFVNLFQWLNLVDMRNKYRVALRRSSPNFSRAMAS